MVIDTSAIVAILTLEPEAEAIAAAIERDGVRLLSAANLLEAAIVIGARHGDAGGQHLDLLLYRSGIEIVPVTREHAELGGRAWLSFGKGRHPAGLNFGDCFAYALSLSAGEPLLCKGEDFCRTDATLVPY
ncbi:MAG: type II toxin-antitoxin system VapC family toxin [Deltaproteobacteria bacterium]|nr:type II toxin-antitoxin system VapC family toxin [Deltaproteobacteria bacterium]